MMRATIIIPRVSLVCIRSFKTLPILSGFKCIVNKIEITGTAWTYCHATCLDVETFEKCSILIKAKNNSAGQRNWTAARLPVRARGMDAPSQREILTTDIH